MSEKPTKQFLIDQIKSLENVILMNTGAINMCRALLEKGIYIEDEVKDNGHTDIPTAE